MTVIGDVFFHCQHFGSDCFKTDCEIGARIVRERQKQLFAFLIPMAYIRRKNKMHGTKCHIYCCRNEKCVAHRRDQFHLHLFLTIIVYRNEYASLGCHRFHTGNEIDLIFMMMVNIWIECLLWHRDTKYDSNGARIVEMMELGSNCVGIMFKRNDKSLCGSFCNRTSYSNQKLSNK